MYRITQTHSRILQDTLSLPSYWFHRVEALSSVTVSLSIWTESTYTIFFIDVLEYDEPSQHDTGTSELDTKESIDTTPLPFEMSWSEEMKWCASLRFANLVLSLLHYKNDFVLELLSSRHDEKCTTIQNIAACSDDSMNETFRNRANSITDKFLEISRKDIREMYLWNWLESIGYFATGSNDIELVSSHFLCTLSQYVSKSD